MILSVDYADVDGNSVPDFAAAHAAGASIVILKAGEHVYPDQHFLRDWKNIPATMMRGCYGFPSWRRRVVNGRTIDCATPAAQVRCWKDTVDRCGGLRPGKDLPFVFDLEFPGNGVTDTGRTQAECFKMLLAFVAEIKAQFGCTPMIYTSHVEFHDTNGLGGPVAPELRDCPLWIKTPYRLQPRQPVDQVMPREPHLGGDPLDKADLWRIPDPWIDSGWFLQQFQGDATGFPGFSKTVDLSRFHTAKLGDHGGHVKWLKRKLQTLGSKSGPLDTTSDVFDADLDLSVKAFQTVHGLVADGIVGPVTFAAIAWT